MYVYTCIYIVLFGSNNKLKKLTDITDTFKQAWICLVSCMLKEFKTNHVFYTAINIHRDYMHLHR